ncbi:hypothetical protein EZS27_033979 [termite gut metagenome]|uniref:Uncharacterized protein n=1 Tax=termite gut metagenome TaxID=433724 RepID=A0A5J4Q139_9ZZZZ
MGRKINNIGNSSVSESKYIKNKTDIPKEEFEHEGNDKLVFISIKELQESFECFSKWNKNEMSKFWDFNKDVHKTTWNDIYKTGGKGKRGFGYTVIPRDNYKMIIRIPSYCKFSI